MDKTVNPVGKQREQMANRGLAMREQALSMAKKRNEEFIGARLPKELRDKVLQRAEQEGVSVSILLRRIIEEVFNGTSVRGDTERGSAKKNDVLCAHLKTELIADVLGWEWLQLNKQVNCQGCRKRLLVGDSVLIGLKSSGGAPVVLCNQCKESI